MLSATEESQSAEPCRCESGYGGTRQTEIFWCQRTTPKVGRRSRHGKKQLQPKSVSECGRQSSLSWSSASWLHSAVNNQLHRMMTDQFAAIAAADIEIDTCAAQSHDRTVSKIISRRAQQQRGADHRLTRSMTVTACQAVQIGARWTLVSASSVDRVSCFRQQLCVCCRSLDQLGRVGTVSVWVWTWTECPQSSSSRCGDNNISFRVVMSLVD